MSLTRPTILVCITRRLPVEGGVGKRSSLDSAVPFKLCVSWLWGSLRPSPHFSSHRRSPLSCPLRATKSVARFLMDKIHLNQSSVNLLLPKWGYARLSLYHVSDSAYGEAWKNHNVRSSSNISLTHCIKMCCWFHYQYWYTQERRITIFIAISKLLKIIEPHDPKPLSNFPKFSCLVAPGTLRPSWG